MFLMYFFICNVTRETHQITPIKKINFVHRNNFIIQYCNKHNLEIDLNLKPIPMVTFFFGVFCINYVRDPLKRCTLNK